MNQEQNWNTNLKKTKIMAVSSSGGHLTELFSAMPERWVKQATYVTSLDQRSDDVLKNMSRQYILDPNGVPLHYIPNFFQTIYCFLRIRPQIIISTGSGIAVFSLLIGKLMGCKIIYVESGARLFDISKTGHLAYKFADLFIVKSDLLQQKYPKSKRARLL